VGRARILINYPIFRLGTTTLVIFFFGCLQPLRCFALPPEADLPEEILRTEIILEGRSPIDGKPLSAREYVELEAELTESRFDPQINEDIQQIIFLLQIRKLFKTIIPFV
jgi:hypothetical protein